MKGQQTAFRPLPLGSIKPGGWLKNQLRIQADGFTGHLEEHWADVGPDNGWLGGKGESWERGPYYLDGLVPLAYLLEDEALIAKARRWVEWALASQRADGNFGPDHITTVNMEVDARGDWWHYMLMLKVLTQYAEATGDERVIPFMQRFFGYVAEKIEAQPLEEWAIARGFEMVLSILWLYGRAPDERLLQLAATVIGQSEDWTAFYYHFAAKEKTLSWDPKKHVVNAAMGIKAPGILYSLSGDQRERDAAYRGMEALLTHHGQAHGMFSGDEWLAGTSPTQGVEFCAVVEFMFSLEHLVQVFGDARFADTLEKVAFNALPAAVSADWTSHQYDQQVNQVICNLATRPWTNNSAESNTFGLSPHFGCCTSNMHQGWPKFASHLWMADGRGGLAAVSYAPCTVAAKVGSGTAAILQVSGEYPFRETVKLELTLERPERFAISLPVPEWCASFGLKINGAACELHVGDNGYASVERVWHSGDIAIVELPMQVRAVARNENTVSVERGPLVFAHPIQESWMLVQQRPKFCDWEVYPASQWKYGLLDDGDFETVEAEIPYQPFAAATTPVKIKANGIFIRNWKIVHNNADTPPSDPDTAGQPVERLELVPYAAAKLRIGEFPVISNRG